MWAGIRAIKVGGDISEIGKAIESNIGEYVIVREFCGHGIGKEFHTEPHVLSYYNPAYKKVIENGMFFTVEPIIINNDDYNLFTRPDKWTAVDKNDGLSAQFEHTVGIWDDEVHVLTDLEKSSILSYVLE